MSDQLLAQAHRFLDWARDRGARLDGTDDSVFFLQGVIESMAEDDDEEPAFRAIKLLAYSVYLAELLADTCTDVRCVVEAEGTRLDAVNAVQAGGATQFTLNWLHNCLNDHDADNLAFKYAGALQDFGEHDRAQALYALLVDD
ncbi:hypothetical protein [Nocardia sp. NPDC049149]|uniref:hypothetical protein n=1 Tax=Nocardia sp. NPDC049149 TaxID=3364315 RepID=UPI0037189F80